MMAGENAALLSGHGVAGPALALCVLRDGAIIRDGAELPPPQRRHRSLIAQDDAQLFAAGIVTFHRVARLRVNCQDRP